MSQPSRKPAFIYVLGSEEVNMRILCGYKLVNEEIAMDDDKAEVVRSIFAYYLAGAGLGKVVEMLFAKGIPYPTGKPRWTRAAVDKLLGNAKYIPLVGLTTYMDVQFEKNRRCNVDYDRADHPRKATRYQSPVRLFNCAFFCYTDRRGAMTEEEVSKLHARLAIQFDAMLATLLAKGLIFEEIIPDCRKDLPFLYHCTL